VVRDDETWESVSQGMSGSLKAGQCYAFSVWLCRSEKYLSRRSYGGDSLFDFTHPAVLRIFGGKTFCEEGELLAESDPVVDHQWHQYVFKFEPIRDYRYITLQAFYKTPVLTPYNGHILVDHCSPIVRVPCSENDVTKVFEEPEEKPVQPVNSKPAPVSPPVTNTKHATPKTPAPTSNVPVDDAKPKLLDELDRQKLHEGKTIRIERLYFKADSSRIEEESYPVLDEIAQFLINNPDIIIEIGGHTNTKPSPEYCNQLSTARAKSVMDYLIDAGVPKEQLQYKGYGKTQPLVPNDTYSRSAQAKNQRVEIKVLKLG
jgi:outer membrane protein OmpA-like peptidoglycan-associated protein